MPNLPRLRRPRDTSITAVSTAEIDPGKPRVEEISAGGLQKVYVEALQRKAASLGQVESVHEGRGDDGELELTIKVRVP